MLLQSSLQNPNVSLSSSLCHLQNVQPKTVSLFLSPKKYEPKRIVGVRCSISQVHSYGTVDYERRPALKWNLIYKKISLMERPELGSGSVLNQWERDGKVLTKWELCRVVKELRKYKRFNRALEVYEWMNNRGERFRISSSDAAIQLDLIGKVRGISGAENFFLSLSESSKDRRIYGALLNAYVRARKKEKAESLLDRMRAKDFTTHCLPFNVMMTLYMNLKDYEKVDAIIAEMIEKNVQLDVYSYNIWLSCRGSIRSAKGMEEVYERMRLDKTVNPNWTTFSTMATMYIKMGMLEKADECLRKVESRISGRNRIPYHYLLSLYGGVGNKDEIYRVWGVYRAVFPTVPNLGYHSMISALLRVGEVEGAEKIYEEWLPVRSSFDPRIVNLFVVHFVKNRDLEKALVFVDRIEKDGGRPNSGTWEALADGYIGQRDISEALMYWKEAFGADGAKNWRPKPSNVTAFLALCDEEGDLKSREFFVGKLRDCGYLKDAIYASHIKLPHENENDGEKEITPLEEGSFVGDDDDNDDDESESEMVLNQL